MRYVGYFVWWFSGYCILLRVHISLNYNTSALYLVPDNKLGRIRL